MLVLRLHHQAWSPKVSEYMISWMKVVAATLNKQWLINLDTLSKQKPVAKRALDNFGKEDTGVSHFATNEKNTASVPVDLQLDISKLTENSTQLTTKDIFVEKFSNRAKYKHIDCSKNDLVHYQKDQIVKCGSSFVCEILSQRSLCTVPTLSESFFAFRRCRCLWVSSTKSKSKSTIIARLIDNNKV